MHDILAQLPRETSPHIEISREDKKKPMAVYGCHPQRRILEKKVR